jgi:transcription elongation factor SPT6
MHAVRLQVPKDKLLPILDQAIANVVNITGVEINRAIRDPYYRSLLPFVAGLGPRKANGMVKRISVVVSND